MDDDRPERRRRSTGAVRPTSRGDGLRLRSREGRAVIAAAVLGSALAYMSDDMLNVALPSLAADLDVDVSQVQWVVNAYFVTMLSLTLTAGSIGDVRGHRRTFVAGLVVFVVGALVAAVAPSIPLVIAGRAVQGIGAALLLSCGLALVNGSFGERERGQAVGLYMGATAVATAAGPALGGLLVDLSSWRAVFVAPLVLPVAAVFVTQAAVPESVPDRAREVDTGSAALALLTIASLSIALIRGPMGWMRGDVVAALVVAAIGGGAFVRRQRRLADPMVPLDLFRNRTFSGGNVVTLLSYTVSAGAFLFLVVHLQTTLGYRPVLAGAALVPLYVVMVIGSPASGRLADRIGPRVPIVVGNLVLAAGVWWLSAIGPGSSFVADVLPGILVLAVGLATLGAPLTSATLGAVGETDQGIASGVNTTVGQLAGLLMIVVLPAVAGLSGGRLDGPGFADGYRVAMRACVLLCLVAAGVAWSTLRPEGASATLGDG